MMINIYFCHLDNTTMPIFHSLRQIRNRNIKIWISEVDKNEVVRIQARDLNIIEHSGIDRNLGCYRWDISAEQIEPLYDCNGLKHLVARYICEGTFFICVDNAACTNNQLVMFQDAPHLEEYPKAFVKIPCFNEFGNIRSYLIEQGALSFSLDNEDLFKKCNGIVIQGANVYREISTGRYWYLDMLHKNHYEVFDKTGNRHIGEADLRGNIDSSKAEKGRSINF